MLRVTIAGVRGHLVRFVLSALAVTLGVAFIAGTFVLTDSIRQTFDELFAGATEGVDVVVRGEQGVEGDFGTASAGLPLDLEDDIADVDGVQRVAPDIVGTALLVGSDGTAVRGGGAPTFGFAFAADDPALTVIDGRGPRSASEIAVESSTLERSGLALGDTTQVVLGSGPQDVTLVGEAEFDAPLAGATIVLLEEAAAIAAFAPDGTVGAFTVTSGEGVEPASLLAGVEAVVPDTAEVITGQQQADENEEGLSEALGFINTFLLVFAVVALFVGAFIIFNTFSMLVAQRTRELALLRAVGASRAQVLRSVLGEAALVGLLGGALGLGVGVGVAALLQVVLSTIGLEIDGSLPVAPRTVVVALVTGVSVTMLSAVFPAIRAARIAPVAAMRDDVALPERSLRVRGVIGAVMALAGGSLLLWSLLGDAPGGALATGAGALVTFVGVAVLAPLLARPVLRAICAPLVAVLGFVARLARENGLRNPRRTATTASALMIGLALVSAVSVLATSANASIAELARSELTADYVLSAGGQAPVPTGLAGDVRGIDGVSAVAAVGGASAEVNGTGVFAGAVDPDDLLATVAITTVGGDLADVGGDAGDARVALDETTAETAGVSAGDRVQVAVGTLAATEVEVAAVYEDSPMLGAGMVLPTELYETSVPEGQRADFYVYVSAEEGTDLAVLREDLTSVVRPYVVISVLDREEFTGEQTAQINQLLGILYALLALSVVIAVLGIINTLALSVIERTREIGLLRAVGLTRRQLASAVAIESVATAVFGALLGIALGLFFGVALQRAVADDGLDVLAIPVQTLVVVLLLSGVVGVLAAILPAWRAVRLNTLRAITTE